MELLHHALHLAEVPLADGGRHDRSRRIGSAFFHCADQKVLRCMCKIHKFQHLRLIAAALKQIRADCVRGKRRKALLDNSVARYQSQFSVLPFSPAA